MAENRNVQRIDINVLKATHELDNSFFFKPLNFFASKLIFHYPLEHLTWSLWFEDVQQPLYKLILNCVFKTHREKVLQLNALARN